MFAGAPYASIYSLSTGLCGPLGKNKTVGSIEDEIRVEMNIIDGGIVSQVFLDQINWACDELKERLGIAGRYVCWTSLGVGSSFDLSGVAMRGIMKVVDSQAGVVRMVSPEEFERDFDLYDNSVVGVQEGETLRLKYGSGVTPGTVKLYYFRHVIPAESRDDYPDIPDSYTHILKETVKRSFN